VYYRLPLRERQSTPTCRRSRIAGKTMAVELEIKRRHP